MMKWVIFLGILLVILVFLCGVAGAARLVEIALEAELANTIQAPMVVDIPASAKAQGGPEPDEPSNGKFIWAPGRPVEGGANDGKGFAEFIINIPEKAKYYVWGRVIAWDGNSDSFWVTWRPADPDENPQQTANTQFRWGVAAGNTWHWDKINHWLDGGTFDREWELDKGETRLKIWTREDATMLDCLFITTNASPNEAGAAVRTPTEEDRKLQIQGKVKLAVDAKIKLPITWGDIKAKY